MPPKPDTEILAALAAVVDEISASGEGLRWWPGEKVAPIAYRRWRSYHRRNKSRATTREQRIVDLIKGLQAHFEPDVPYTHVTDWRSLAEPLATVLESKS